MAQRWTLDSEFKVKNFGDHVAMLRLAGKPPTVEFIQPGRSLSQNDMFYALYAEIAKQVEDQSIVDIKRECKLRYGVPILRGHNERFKQLYDKAIRENLTYEEKLSAMDILPVTSLMNKTQGSEYIDVIIREYSKQGISIVHPGEEL